MEVNHPTHPASSNTQKGVFNATSPAMRDHSLKVDGSTKHVWKEHELIYTY